MLALDPDRLHTEIEQILEILNGIKAKIEAGIPGEELPANDLDVEVFKMRLRRELVLSAQRVMAVVDSMGDE